MSIKTKCVLCEERDATADIRLEGGNSAKARIYPSCGVCRAAVAISNRTGIPSLASQSLATLDRRATNPSGLLLP